MKFPLLFVGTQKQNTHWMHERLLSRIGHTPDQFHYVNVEDGQDAYVKALQGIKVVCPLGEEGLWATMMEDQPQRWVMRGVPQKSRGGHCPFVCPLTAASVSQKEGN
jgi:hypothetical protein